MNNLFSSSWRRDHTSPNASIHQMPSSGDFTTAGSHLEKFYSEVESIKEELTEIERSRRSLHESNESLKTLHSSSAVREIRAGMDGEISGALTKAKLIKLKLESLDRSNESSRMVTDCGPGSSTDRTRTSLLAGLRMKLKDQMDAFADLRRRVAADHREVVARRYYAVTGEVADEATVEAMAATGEGGESVLRAAMEGRAAVEAAAAEMRERRGAAEGIERSLRELQQVFLDMAVMVDSQGLQIDDIESQVGKASSFVEHGVRELSQARSHQKNTMKWTCIAVFVIILLLLIIVLPIVLKK